MTLDTRATLLGEALALSAFLVVVGLGLAFVLGFLAARLKLPPASSTQESFPSMR